MSTVGDILKKTLPVIATALGGPLAGLAVDAVTSFLGIPKESAERVRSILEGMPPEKLLQMKRIDAELQIRLAELGYESVHKLEELNIRADEAVNATMRAEAASEHWPTYAWRPFIGFVFGITFMFVAGLCCYLAYLAVVDGHVNAMATIPAIVTSFTALFGIPGAILGVSAFFRGKMQADPTIPTTNRG